MLSPLFLAALLPCSHSGTPYQVGAPAEPPLKVESTNTLDFSAGQDRAKNEVSEAAPVLTNPKAAAAAKRACDWLVAQQNPDGSWSPAGRNKERKSAETELGDDEFWDRALGGQSTDQVPAKTLAAGDPLHSIGVTGLAIIALTEGGNTMVRGRHEGTILKAMNYLLSQQDKETGLIGKPIGHAFHYDHAIATFALARLNFLDRPPTLLKKLQLAANYIARARNPYGVWRYDNPPNGDNDSSITTWMTLAIGEAAKSGVKVDRESLASVIEWFNEMTEEGTGRIGYTETGSTSSRVPGQNTDFATDPETLTAAGLVSRLVAGQTPKADPVLVSHVRCILQALPDKDTGGLTDAVWLYFGTISMQEIGSRPWEKWSKAMIPHALAAQGTAGSFDPQSVAWGFSTGRVGTTALTAAALHVASR